MARIRPARGGQDRSGDGATPPPGGARPPAPRRRTPAKQASKGAKQTPQPRPTQPGQRRKPEKAGSVTKAVAQQRRGSRFLSTAVVLMVVAIVAVYLAALDAVFERLIDAIF
jgi:hypothetical protein